MNKIFAFSLALALPLSVSPLFVDTAQAKNIEDLVKVNCTEAIMSTPAELNRAEVAKFQLSKDGSGYSYWGVDEKHRSVSCTAAADGHVTWVNGG
jgi:hypothetical protein